MDSGMHDSTPPDKARGSVVNGVSGNDVPVKSEAPTTGNKVVDNGPAVDYGKLESSLRDVKREEPPDELQHITEGVMPLSLLLTRLAQFSHMKLQELILELASKPLPEHTLNGNAKGPVNSGINGSVNTANGGAKMAGHIFEDTSPESLDKKTMLLKFIQDLHSRWVKALVITEWARNADEVGKLIDLRIHLAEKLELYNKAFWNMIHVKQEMVFAKVPSPDLKTALEVLSAGAVHWMPDFGYLPKPPLEAQEISHWLNEIEVTLHMRLQLHEYERIPEPWKQYKIDNGRVTFTVPGEFEVDLTISDEDFGTQFWFLDYRPLFSPAPPKLSDGARAFIEGRVNKILETEGLPGCYKYLHEMALTAKIGEFTRQAVELNRTGLWAETLKVERLNRALGIQYWVQSSHTQGPGSWILLGTHSGKNAEGASDPDSPSRLVLQWFRDGKEVKDADIPFDANNISTEKLLTAVISRHIRHLLSTIFNTLQAKPRYARKQGKLALRISDQPGTDSALTMQLLGKVDAVLRIGMWSGNFYFADRSPLPEWAHRLNSSRNPATEGPGMLEAMRWAYTVRYLRTLPRPADWVIVPQPPVLPDEVKRVVYSHAPTTRELFHPVWMRNTQWSAQWFAMMSLSLGGDRWWLVEVTAEGHGLPGFRISTFTELPITPTDLLPPAASLIPKLTKHTTNIMAQIDDLRGLHQQRVPHTASKFRESGSLTTYVLSADMLGHQPDSDEAPRTTWAAKFIPLVYKGPAPVPISEYRELLADLRSPQRQPARQRVMVEAKVDVTNRSRLQLLERNLDRDVMYDRRAGQFILRLQPDGSSGAIPLLRARMQALDRLVGIVDGLGRGGKHVTPERITLREVVFSYSAKASAARVQEAPRPDHQSLPSGGNKQRSWKVRLDLAWEKGVNVMLEPGNPHLRVLDYLRTAANSPQFKKLPSWLLFTLPLFEALERLQASWDAVLAKEQGTCYIFHKSMDWVTIRFTLTGAKDRPLHLDIRPRDRGGELMWHVYRPATDPNVNNESDKFNAVLKERVWSTNGRGFKGLMNGAAATWDDGIGNLLGLIDETLQSLAGTQASLQQASAQASQSVQRPQQPQAQELQNQKQPQQQQQQQQQRQQQPQQGLPLHGGGVPGRFPHQFQQGQQQAQHQFQQARLQQQQMHSQAQAQGQQRPGGVGSSNAPVVVLD